VHAPWTDDDRAMDFGYQCILIPPTADEDWFVVDDSKRRMTLWGRWREGPA
jgi:hypothetical protein